MQVIDDAKTKSRNRTKRDPTRFGPAVPLRFPVALILVFVISGCATPIGVRYVDPGTAYHTLTANVLSAEMPSSFTSRELINSNLYQRFEDEPEKALAVMHAGLAPNGDEDRVFALAELSLSMRKTVATAPIISLRRSTPMRFFFEASMARRRRGSIHDSDGRPIFTTRRSRARRC